MRILLADDAALLREAIEALLERLGHQVIATAADATELVTIYESLSTPPDLIITDVRMPPTRTDDGLRAALKIRATNPTQPILALSQYVADRYARELLSLPEGAVGYLLKERVNRVADFAQALQTVADGGTIIDTEITRHLLQNEQPGALDSLTEREREVLTLMAGGASNTEIAKMLFVSDAAVRKHIGNIFAGLGLQPTDENRRVRAILAFLQAHEKPGFEVG